MVWLCFLSKRCLQERELWTRKLRCHHCCSILRVQVQATIQAAQLQERSVVVEFECFFFWSVLICCLLWARHRSVIFSRLHPQHLPAGPTPVRTEALARRVPNAPPSSVPAAVDTAETSAKSVNTITSLFKTEIQGAIQISRHSIHREMHPVCVQTRSLNEPWGLL